MGLHTTVRQTWRLVTFSVLAVIVNAAYETMFREIVYVLVTVLKHEAICLKDQDNLL